jgi:fibronectin type 3 domain-containing protein
VKRWIIIALLAGGCGHTPIQPPVPHSISMKWDPDTCNCVYNVYRGQPAQALTRIDQVPGPAYTDRSVQGGQTYVYTVQAHDNETGLESDQSNAAIATVPK